MESGIQGIFHVPAGSSCAVNHIPAQQGLPAEEYDTAGGPVSYTHLDVYKRQGVSPEK